jgi:ATP-binding cassette subfamily F protein uup
MGRVGRLMEMRKQYAERRNLVGKAEFTVQEAAASGKLVAEAKNVSYAVDGKQLLRNVSLNVIRGDKIGIIGPNGAGKTTLLNLLLGRLQPSSGELKTGTNIEVAWFDQMRATLDENKPVWENIAGGKEFVVVGEGENAKRKHVMGYLQEFLFTPDRARSPTRVLSGGERARLLLAQLFSQPANLLVLDEPTNDLDVETLDLLEELLLDFGGTVLVVSHDRAFLDNVVTQVIAFEGSGRLMEYVGGYEDWVRVKKYEASQKTATAAPAKAAPKAEAAKPKASTRLNFKEQKELEEMPKRIEALEREQEDITAVLASGTLFRDNPAHAKQLQQRAAEIEDELLQLMTRWEALESR